MIIKHIDQDDKEAFYSLCRDFYSSGATKRPFDEKIHNFTFQNLMSKHENLDAFLMIDATSQRSFGYALVTSYWCNEDGGKVVVLDELYIDPNFRKHGYGKELLSFIEKQFGGDAVSITLEVLTSNILAKDLYAKMGYLADGFEVLTKKLSS